MRTQDTFSKILAVIGTALVWLPILAPIFLAILSLISQQGFRVDYLMPAELFSLAAIGSVLLIWAAFRARARRGLIAGGLAVALGALVGGQVLATITGLASGETEIGGWQWALVLISLGIYIAALVIIGIGGILLTRDLFTSSR